MIDIGWVRSLTPDVAGKAGPSGGQRVPGWSRYNRGSVALNANLVFPLGYGHTTWVPIVLHEMGHVLGLDHVTDNNQVMYSGEYGSDQPTYGLGDLAGLYAVGAAQGCL